MTDLPAAGASLPDGPHRRTHPLSPVIAAVRTVGVLIGAIVVFGSQGVRDVASAVGGLVGLLILLGSVLVVLIVAVGWQWLAWTRTEFFFDGAGDFRLDSGVLQRSERRVTLSRLQGVDVVRPLLGRVVGLAQVRIEVAGTGNTRVLVSYLTDADAQALRAEIVARAAGVDPSAGEAPERVLASVPPGDLALSLAIRSETLMLLLVSVLVVAGAVLSEGLAGLPVLLLTGGLPLAAVFTQFVRFFGFTLAESPDGLRLRHGLASVQSQTVPPGRIQAVEVEQPLLWRSQGWVRVSLNVAGVHGSDDTARVEQVLLPVAPREVAAEIVSRVLPGTDLAALEFQPAPRAARLRAWLQWPNLGVAVGPAILATRRGFLTRRIALIPHARTQSVRVTQGPWQRRLGLASMHVDSTPGPVTVVGLHRVAAEARQLAEEQLLRAARARATGPADRWMAPPPPPRPAPHTPADPSPVPARDPAGDPSPVPASDPAGDPSPGPADPV